MGGHYADEQKRVLGATFGGAASLELVRAERPERRVGQIPLQARVAGGAARVARGRARAPSRTCCSSATSTSRPTTATCTTRRVAGPSAVHAGRASGARERICELGLERRVQARSSSRRRSSAGGITARVAFRRNQGLRIDLVLASQALSQTCSGCRIDKEPRGWERPSDHVPVVAEFAAALALM